MSKTRIISKIKKVAPSGGDLEEAGVEVRFSVIFDMDGTLIDNTPFHYKAWQQLFKKHHLPELSRETYKAEISGVPILNTVEKYFPDADKETQKEIVNEKQHLYQQAYLPFLRPINGLENFLFELKARGVKIALATSSDITDVDFIFNAIPIRQYFDAIVTGSMVSQPKPSPQIFLKAAEQLNTLPVKCVVFEDSTAGLQAGKNAGMKVAGITTAHPAAVISKAASIVINDYTDVNLHKLSVLFD